MKTVLAYVLLVFGLVANLCSILGFWLSYLAAPQDVQAHFNKWLLLGGATGAALAYLGIGIWFLIRLRQPVLSEQQLRKLIDEALESKHSAAIGESLPAQLGASKSADGRTVFDAELHRIFIYPRIGLDFEAYKQIRKAQGLTGDPVVDVDVLILLYVVNVSSETRYLRDLRGSVEVGSKRHPMITQSDFTVDSVFGGSCEYGWDERPTEFSREPSPLEALLAKPSRKMESRSPIQGWARMVLKDVDPDKIDSNTWQFFLVDSDGKEYLVTKTVDTEKKGDIALRKIATPSH